MSTRPILSCRSVLMLLVPLLLGGCAVQSDLRLHKIAVQSFAHSPDLSPSPQHYVIYSEIEGVTADDPDFRQAATYLEQVLSSKNMVRVADLEKADLAVGLFYRLEGPQKARVVTGRWPYFPPELVTINGLDGSTIYVTLPRVPSEIWGTEFHYNKILAMRAIDLRAYRGQGEVRILWDTRVACSDKSDHLQSLIPVMMAAADDYIGRQSYEPKTLFLAENDRRVRTIRGI